MSHVPPTPTPVPGLPSTPLQPIPVPIFQPGPTPAEFVKQFIDFLAGPPLNPEDGNLVTAQVTISRGQLDGSNGVVLYFVARCSLDAVPGTGKPRLVASNHQYYSGAGGQATCGAWTMETAAEVWKVVHPIRGDPVFNAVGPFAMRITPGAGSDNSGVTIDIDPIGPVALDAFGQTTGTVRESRTIADLTEIPLLHAGGVLFGTPISGDVVSVVLRRFGTLPGGAGR